MVGNKQHENISVLIVSLFILIILIFFVYETNFRVKVKLCTTLYEVDYFVVLLQKGMSFGLLS
jgi:uncharacterized integral membrane protein